MRVRTRLVALLAAGAAILPMTASAAPTAGSGGTTNTCGTATYITQHQLCAHGTLQFVNIGNDVYGEVICDAEAFPDAVAVAITSCTVDNQAAPNLSFPGPVAVTAGSIQGNLADTFDVCWTATAVFAEDRWGPQIMQTAGCNQL